MHAPLQHPHGMPLLRRVGKAWERRPCRLHAKKQPTDNDLIEEVFHHSHRPCSSGSGGQMSRNSSSLHTTGVPGVRLVPCAGETGVAEVPARRPAPPLAAPAECRDARCTIWSVSLAQAGRKPTRGGASSSAPIPARLTPASSSSGPTSGPAALFPSSNRRAPSGPPCQLACLVQCKASHLLPELCTFTALPPWKVHIRHTTTYDSEK